MESLPPVGGWLGGWTFWHFLTFYLNHLSPLQGYFCVQGLEGASSFATVEWNIIVYENMGLQASKDWKPYFFTITTNTSLHVEFFQSLIFLPDLLKSLRTWLSIRKRKLASEGLLCQNKKISSKMFYLQWGLKSGPLPFGSDALLSEPNCLLFAHDIILGLKWLSDQ